MRKLPTLKFLQHKQQFNYIAVIVLMVIILSDLALGTETNTGWKLFALWLLCTTINLRSRIIKHYDKVKD